MFECLIFISLSARRTEVLSLLRLNFYKGAEIMASVVPDCSLTGVHPASTPV